MSDAVKRIVALALASDDFGQRVLDQVAQECSEAETPADLAAALARTRALRLEAEEGAEALSKPEPPRRRGRGKAWSLREAEHRLARKVARRGGGTSAEAHRFAVEVAPVRRDVPAPCGGRHRRASGAAARRRRGSRRATGSGDRAGPGDGDDDGGDEPSSDGRGPERAAS